MTVSRQELVKKWAPILEAADLPAIASIQRKEHTAQMLENYVTEEAKSQSLHESAPANAVGGYSDTGGFAKYDPVLVSLIRRAMPQLIAYDIADVQPMNLPTGIVFAMKSRYTSQSGSEALFNEANTGFSGTGTHAGNNPAAGTYTTGTAMATSDGERLGRGGAGDGSFGEMAFSIEKVTVTAKTRALKAEYTQEIAQDMKSVHGLNAESELTNILSTEILSEINREVIRTVYTTAKVGAQVGTATAGTFDMDVDSNGRWSVEKFKGLMFQIERESNAIFQDTRRGRGNFILCSADVASALAMAGKLDYAPALSTDLDVSNSSTTFAGVLNGKYKVFVDPYAANSGATQFFTVGYKGGKYDAGLFYCPYVPLQMVRATDPNSFQPKLAFKTRYALIANPFVDLDDASGATGDLTAGKNYYYRKVAVTNLM